MQLTILGSAASWAGAGQACSGYLIEDEGTTVLLDCGSGTLANAGEVTGVTSLDAVVISHAHPDHCVDLYQLYMALQFGAYGPVGDVPLHLPEGLWDKLACLLSERSCEYFRAAFDLRTMAAGAPIEVEGITLTPHAVDHEGPTFAFMIEAGGAKLGYTADSRAGAAVLDAVRGCDVLLADCTLPDTHAGTAAHMTAAECGSLARDAGAGMLILTHLWPEADHDQMRRTAASVFSGQVHLAESLMTIEIPPVRSAGEGDGR